MSDDGRRRFARSAWWGAAGGALLAATDTAFLLWLGVRFDMNGRDVTLLVAAFFGSSSTALGWLVGRVLEGRRRERRDAAIIQAQTDTLAATRARLAQHEKLAALGQLAAAIAHEVRNPLAVIRSAAQGLGEAAAPGDTESERAASFITAEVDRLANVVNSLLAFARPLHPEPRPVGVGELFDRALLLARTDLAAHRLRVRRDDAPDLPAARADPDLLCQVLLGLLANAIESAPAGGELTLTGRAANGAVELVVADSGPGVPAELRERIFEPFFTTRPRGTGLGLAVARQIVEAHGGRIAVDDQPAGGARFTVRLPAAA